MNPIYIAYYSHENGDCYKIDLPWSKYKKDTRVLCLVSRGLEYAKLLAIGLINQHLIKVMNEDIIIK
jgi:hypothetical protein